MQSLASKYVVSVSEVKKNPTGILKDANHHTVAVLNHNKPIYYMVDPEVYETLLEAAYDREITPVIQERLELRRQAVEVSPDEL